MHLPRWLGLFALIAFQIVAPSPQTTTTPTLTGTDIRVILQTQAGLAAYATLTDTLPLNLVRPLFSTLEVETSTYIQGEYTLAGRADKLKLAIGTAGWAIAWHPRHIAAQRLFDCLGFTSSVPTGQPEKAVLEVANALSITTTIASFYDFRNPQATGMVMHWLYLPGSGNQTATLNLPLFNTYQEHGYFFCTALTNSKFRLNDQMVDQQGSLSQIVYRDGTLSSSQLRAGQTNNLKIEALSFFGTGFYGGVTTVYSGTTALTSSGGARRDFTLSYPAMLGAPLTLMYLPVVRR